MWSRLSGALVVSVAWVSAAVIGASVATPSVSEERIASLPREQQAVWREYLARSVKQEQADRDFLQAELKTAGLASASVPPNGRNLPLHRPAEWYASGEARRIADIVVSFQTPAGGWSKNINLTDHVRKPGERFAPNNLSAHLAPGDFDTPRDPQWNYVGTLDNDATTTEIEFLAKVGEPYRAAVARGIEYLLAAQFPNGGWPQVWPLEGGYHDAVTFNDGAVTHALEVLQAVAAGDGPYAFVPERLRDRCARAVEQGIACILAAQVVENGKRTVWAQQHDALDLRPVSGRNYEPAGLCSSESAELVLFLMGLPKPGPGVMAAVSGAVDWFRRVERESRWARFYEIGTGRPIFGDRDKSIHDDVNEISAERRRGYRWYNTAPQEVLDRSRR